MAEKNIENLGHRESLEGLPQNLLDTLSISRINDLDKEILNIIKSFDGVATLDEIAIRHYRQTKKVEARSKINNRLLALVRKGFLQKRKGKKGIYEIVDSNNNNNQQTETSVSENNNL